MKKPKKRLSGSWQAPRGSDPSPRARRARGRGSLPRGPEGPESRPDVRARGPVGPEGELRVPRASAREVSLPAYIHMFLFIRAKMAIFRRQFGGLNDGEMT